MSKNHIKAEATGKRLVDSIDPEKPGDGHCSSEHTCESIACEACCTEKEENMPGDKIKDTQIRPLGHLLRFFGWWFAFIGLYSVSSVCPFCGQAGCPVGAGSAGVVGAFMAVLVQMRNWKIFAKTIKDRFKSVAMRYTRHS